MWRSLPAPQLSLALLAVAAETPFSFERDSSSVESVCVSEDKATSISKALAHMWLGGGHGARPREAKAKAKTGAHESEPGAAPCRPPRRPALWTGRGALPPRHLTACRRLSELVALLGAAQTCRRAGAADFQRPWRPPSLEGAALQQAARLCRLVHSACVEDGQSAEAVLDAAADLPNSKLQLLLVRPDGQLRLAEWDGASAASLLAGHALAHT